MTLQESHTKTSTDLGARQVMDLFAAADGPVGHDVWEHVQRGLIYPSPYAVFATFWRAEDDSAPTLSQLSGILADLRNEIHADFGSAHTTVVAGVGFRLWHEWCRDEGMKPPEGMRMRYPSGERGVDEGFAPSKVFERSNGTFVDSAADLWFHIKSANQDHCPAVFERLDAMLAATGRVDTTRTVQQQAATKSVREDLRGGKVVGCRFSENLNNPTSPVSFQKHTLVGLDDPGYLGASFVLAQRFTINWSNLLNMNPDQIEDLVGRTADDVIIPSRDDRSHISRSRAQDETGDTTPLLRLSLPYGTSPALGDDDLLAKGASRRDEKGIYFAGFANSVATLEKIMDQQIGRNDGFMADRLLSNVRSDLGGFYFIPSQLNLRLDPAPVPDLAQSWDKFPGVDWERLDRHFDRRSDNGYMYYNHHDYMHRMSTIPADQREHCRPPSGRVLRLLESTFSRWQDGWYFDRAQQELEHLSAYVERYAGIEQARKVMALPVVERMGWAIKIGLGKVFAGHDYGFRGRRHENGRTVNGADTYHVDPAELIVGGMPNLGLGQGKYVIDYTREDEQLQNFFRGLSAASGVGHVVPDYQRLLDKGLDGLISEVTAKLDTTDDEGKRQFYRAVVLALEGVSDHCLAFADLAAQLAHDTQPSQRAELENLLAIHGRMRKLAHQPPDTLLEAAQLIFTLHSCLHLVGEPTAIGRLDQLLEPFRERDAQLGLITDEQAQEIIDCFWVKLGEKVLWNRTFVEDHQPFGNMAMGGFSGNYPQGGANNQWVQQITVGGTLADGAPGEGTPAYNDTTMLCLLAARRLPLNAPCLSLRVRPDMPREYAEEAARALLSGGAHPILLNDAKIIPGLVRSGEGIGDGDARTEFTPVREKAGQRWRSEVPLDVARDYACDGCYEPQFVGKNWFTLGQVNMLHALEATLNQGKSWLTAGPMYFRGQKVSFTSPKPAEITSFEQLLELYFKHVRWMYAKQVDGQLGAFGQMSDVCPSPLMSCFIDDCIETGLDYYAGGARYNVIAPGLIALPNAVNSLLAIKHLVYEPTTAATSLPELVEALMCDWGESMAEPFTNSTVGAGRIAAHAERFRDLRRAALDLPRYGRGVKDVDDFGNRFLRRVSDTVVSVLTRPAPPTARTMVELAKRIGTPEHPFGVQLQPGVGTFENYLEFGAATGASPDGRRRGETLASDLSPAPSPVDLPVDHQEKGIIASLRGFTGDGADALWDAAPTDFNIREDFPHEALVQVIEEFARGAGSNLLTITCADPETMTEARRDPEQYDLLRVRMGGWSEYFISMFPDHQHQHQRRPISTADTQFPTVSHEPSPSTESLRGTADTSPLPATSG
ncbi:Dyp-type peroxidase family [Saccharothrix ecbatanensis]|uniref:Dyp-type peroxidase family n=1 Tax=Saccharothrix ecbatanensis TaxID=1105145 RepID=A0A7W9HK30_9PSEU|nr:Dyp-type peroxidase [Saccharothrix ecbatanensis]MBB5803289.1 Dyp-type peroxidase family [Saccharothrix ecbatanensis]